MGRKEYQRDLMRQRRRRQRAAEELMELWHPDADVETVRSLAADLLQKHRDECDATFFKNGNFGWSERNRLSAAYWSDVDDWIASEIAKCTPKQSAGVPAPRAIVAGNPSNADSIDVMIASGLMPHEIAARMGVSRVTASLWVNRHSSPHSLLNERLSSFVAVCSEAIASGELPLPRRLSRAERLEKIAELFAASNRETACENVNLPSDAGEGSGEQIYDDQWYFDTFYEDYEKALAGFADYQRKLGDHMDALVGGESEAERWYRMGAENGDPKSQQALARLIECTTDGQSEEANHWFRRAALQGNVEAQVDLAYNFETGLGRCIPSKLESMAWRRMAALSGDVASMIELGELCRAEGTVYGDREALYWFTSACDVENDGETHFRKAESAISDLIEKSEDPEVAYQGALFYYKCHPEGNEEWVAWKLRSLARSGHTEAQYRLGDLLLVQPSLEEHTGEAVHWLEAAASWGSTDAQYRLARIYRDGLTVAQDAQESARWLHLVALGGSSRRRKVQSRVTLAKMFAAGEGLDHNDQQAHHNMQGAKQLVNTELRAWERLAAKIGLDLEEGKKRRSS